MTEREKTEVENEKGMKRETVEATRKARDIDINI